jgi:arginyl-tRNA synthetase
MVQNQLSSALEKALKKAHGIDDAAISWSRPVEASHGDLATPIALQLSKKIGMKPADLAAELKPALESESLVEKVEIAGPGYLNIWLTPKGHLERLSDAQNACDPEKTRKEAPVIIEFSQPNIAKPLGVHHIIGTAMGQAIVNLYRHAGFKTISWNYIGDWGTQFGKLAVAYEKWGGKKPVKDHSIDELLTLYVRFHDEVEKDKTLEEQGREAFRRLEKGDKQLRAFWEDVVSVTKASLADVYRRLHVEFDLDLGESFYEDKMESVLTEGKKKHVFTEGEGGALIVQFPEEKNMPPYLVLKGDGATLYSTRDLAQMRYRMDTYKPQEILIFTDIAQKLHFEQLEETCKMLGWDLPEFTNVLFGRMRFADSSMSTRKGNILNLEEVLDEAVSRADAVIKGRGESIQTDDSAELAEMMGTGALVYGILSQNRKMEIVFDWDRMLSFEGNSAPYLQYTHARTCSVLRKAGAEKVAFPKGKTTADFSQTERDLANSIAQFPEALAEARRQYMPHVLSNYLFALCQSYNTFYNAEPILQSEGATRELRLLLTFLTAKVLRTGAELLTLRVPDRM